MILKTCNETVGQCEELKLLKENLISLSLSEAWLVRAITGTKLRKPAPNSTPLSWCTHTIGAISVHIQKFHPSLYIQCLKNSQAKWLELKCAARNSTLSVQFSFHIVISLQPSPKWLSASVPKGRTAISTTCNVSLTDRYHHKGCSKTRPSKI